MNVKKKALRGSVLLTIGEATVYGASFARNMLLARLLTKADFGIAATFSMVIMLLEFSQRLGISRFVVRDKEGGEPEFIASAHLVQFIAAAFSTLVLALAAWPLAHLFGFSDQRWSLMVLALIPLLRGVEHLDVRRFERELRFGPSALIEMVPQVVITLAAWPVATWLPDYRAVLVLLISKTAMSCVASHVLAERPYRWKVHKLYVSRMLRFGWPLLVNGFLMFGVLHGDQFLVATFYTMSDLGPFAAAATLVTAPTFFFGRVFNSIMLPIMARVQDDQESFCRHYRQALAVISLFSTVCAVGLITGSEALMQLVFGAKYAGAGIILACLAAANAFRNLRIAPALAAMSKGDSQNQMISNLWRVVALLPALAIAVKQYPVWVVACTGLFGEILACSVSLLRLRRRDGIAIKVSFVPGAWVALAIAAAVSLQILGIHTWNPYLVLAVASLAAIAAGLVIIAAIPVLRSAAANFCLSLYRAGWRGGWTKIRQSFAADAPVPAA